MNIIPGWVKWGVLAILLIMVIGFGWYMKGMKDDNAQLRAQQKAMIDRIGKAEDANKRQDETLFRRDQLQNDVRSGVADVTVRIKQEAANDPQTRSFLGTNLPDGMRRAILKNAAARSAAQHQDADAANAH
jgi:hypothetical protein